MHLLAGTCQKQVDAFFRKQNRSLESAHLALRQ